MPRRSNVKTQPSQSEPTILDVARKARVSKSLVSMVIRGDDGVSPKNREAVLNAIEELNYRPNAIARSLVERRTRILGVMISDLRNPFFGDVVSGIQIRAEELGYRVLFNTGDCVPKLEEAAIESLLELRVDGLILAAPRVDDPIIERAGRVLPVVVLNRDTSATHSDSVTNDNIAGAGLAVEHLAGLGHTRIAHIDGGGGAGASVRREGYLRAMRRLGLGDHILTVEGAFTENGGYRGACELLKSAPLPTAIFAANDISAIGALRALEEAGLRTPADVSVVGYDNTSLAALHQISLTSVQQFGTDNGRLGVECLVERIEGKRSTPRHEVHAPTLVVRSSTGPPPNEPKTLS
ncbi:MAG: LacI family transcriptional regulator [Acidobacteriia bacterium]|nr:LacI family transcriptional regulator [Terriglobia bacterium]